MSRLFKVFNKKNSPGIQHPVGSGLNFQHFFKEIYDLDSEMLKVKT